MGRENEKERTSSMLDCKHNVPAIKMRLKQRLREDQEMIEEKEEKKSYRQ